MRTKGLLSCSEGLGHRPPCSPAALGLAAAFAVATAVLPVHAAVIEIGPPSTDTGCREEFQARANLLQPGDELVLHGGRYSQSCRRAIANLHGTPDRPIVIRAAAGEHPVLTRPRRANGDYAHNNLEIVNSSHLIIRGLTFEGGDTGVRFVGENADITFEDNEIRETGNNALALNSGNSSRFRIRRNHIHHTGLCTAGPTEGEGMYLGCNNNRCRVTDSVIERNHIHHLRGTSEGGNDGIEVKTGSHGNVIRGNVIHDTTIGQQFPCIFVYGGGPAVNVVDGNLVWGCGEGIQVVSDAVIQNNVILSSSLAGITAAPHAQVRQVRNVSIVNNTVAGHPTCLFLRWTGATDVVLANNGVYCEAGEAVNAAGLAGARIRANVVAGRLTGATLDGLAFLAGGTAAAAFVDPVRGDVRPRPGSPLLGRADAALTPAHDFNLTPRSRPQDVGAYHTGAAGANPGRIVGPGVTFLPAAGPAPPGTR
jgi:hypothetical protein